MGSPIRSIHLDTTTSFNKYVKAHEDSFIEEIPSSKVFVEHTEIGDYVHVVVDDDLQEEAEKICKIRRQVV